MKTSFEIFNVELEQVEWCWSLRNQNKTLLLARSPLISMSNERPDLPVCSSKQRNRSSAEMVEYKSTHSDMECSLPCSWSSSNRHRKASRFLRSCLFSQRLCFSKFSSCSFSSDLIWSSKRLRLGIEQQKKSVSLGAFQPVSVYVIKFLLILSVESSRQTCDKHGFWLLLRSAQNTGWILKTKASLTFKNNQRVFLVHIL